MSYGIPSLYIASADSQLQLYADKYGHAKCFTKSELEDAGKFILELSENKEMTSAMSKKAVEASKDFRRENADAFVEKYLA